MKKQIITLGAILLAPSLLQVLPFGKDLGWASSLSAQGVGINTTGNPANASALLDIDASPGGNKGLLIPRIALTNVTVGPPISPAPGAGEEALLVYNTNAAVVGGTGKGYYYWSGTQWMPVGANGPTGPTGPAGPTGPTGGGGSFAGCDSVIVFTSSTTWTVPANVQKISVEVWGGGGGGGGGDNASGGRGGGGGGGGYGSEVCWVTPANTLTITVGAGGTGGCPFVTGGNGGPTSITGMTAPASASATGGDGGIAMGGAGGAGGSSAAKINIPGQNGSMGGTAAATFGQGGQSGNGGFPYNLANSGNNGSAGGAPGAGGNGGNNSWGCTAPNNQGGNGMVVIRIVCGGGANGAVGATGPTGPTGAGGGATCNSAAARAIIYNGVNSADPLNSNTTGYTHMFNLSCNITVNKLSFEAYIITTSGTFKIGIYSEDGQTQLINVTSGTISAPATVSNAVASVSLSAGNYYAVVVPVGTTNISIISDYASNLSVANVSGEPVTMGKQTVAASTLPAAFNPVTDITYVSPSFAAILRLDN